MTDAAAHRWRDLYPFSTQHLPIGRHRIHYVDEFLGSGEGRAEVLLLAHGNPTWSFYWREPIKAWRTRYRVIAPDHLGCGLSDKPRGGKVQLTDHIRNLVQLIEQLDLRNVTLVAHDWGGAIGLGAALKVPERFERFVLLNTGAFPPRHVPWRLRAARNPVLGRLAVQGLNLFVRAALRTTVVHKDVITKAVRAGYLAPYDTWQHRRAIYRFVRDIPLSRRHPTYQTLARIESGLEELSHLPFLFVWGMQDWCFTSDCLDRFLQWLPQADVHRLEDAGHWVVEDAPQQVIGLVERFLEAHPVGH